MRVGRTAPLAGIAFIVVYVAAWLTEHSPDTDDPSSTVAAYYNDKSNRVLEIVSAYLFVVAAILFVCFVSALRARLRSAESAEATATSVAYGAALVFAGLLVAGAMALAAVPAGMSLGGIRAPDGSDIINFVQSAGYGMILVGGMLFAATTIAAISFASMRTAAMPRWSAWLGYLYAFVLLFALVWLPQIALLVWVLAMSIVLFRTPSRTEVTASASQSPRRTPATS